MDFISLKPLCRSGRCSIEKITYFIAITNQVASTNERSRFSRPRPHTPPNCTPPFRRPSLEAISATHVLHFPELLRWPSHSRTWLESRGDSSRNRPIGSFPLPICCENAGSCGGPLLEPAVSRGRCASSARPSAQEPTPWSKSFWAFRPWLSWLLTPCPYPSTSGRGYDFLLNVAIRGTFLVFVHHCSRFLCWYAAGTDSQDSSDELRKLLETSYYDYKHLQDSYSAKGIFRHSRLLNSHIPALIPSL